MSKLLSLNILSDYKGIKVQEIDFDSKGEIIEIKGGVGTGKSTTHKAPELAMSGGSTKQFEDPTGEGDFSNEVCISSAEHIYMRTTSKDGKWDGICYQKDNDGKICKNPVINGRKMTPAVARDTFQTELTFGAGRFTSKDPRVQLDFMMDTYSWKLKDMGVIFDKSAPDYKDSILWRLDQAKADRSAKEYTKKAMNGFRNHLEAEGWDEQNVPELVDVEALEAQKKDLEEGLITAREIFATAQNQNKIDAMNKVQSEIDVLTSKASELMGKITAYNSGLEAQEQLRSEKLSTEISKHNTHIDDERKWRAQASESITFLSRVNAPVDELVNWYEKLNEIGSPRLLHSELEALTPLAKVPMTDGKITDFTQKYTDEINMSLCVLSELRKEIAPLIALKANPVTETKTFDPTPYDTSDLTAQITKANETNKINKRWASFFDHQAADENVKEIWKEYCNLFTQIDLGVPGLTLSIVGDDEKSEIRTMYDGRYNPDLFDPNSKEVKPRLISQYSETQRPIIAILMQKYLLDEKIKKGDDGLRAIFVEMPMDMKTRLTLKQMKNEFDIDIFTSTTGDFTVDGLEEGQFLIENGYLLNK